MRIPAKVFFVYSHKDEDLRDQLEVQLSMLRREGLIESWHDRRITAGSHLDQTIDAKLEKAHIILLLVSPDFLTSEYCYDIEMNRALERHESGEARVIPVILRPCDWIHPPLENLLAVPLDGKPVTTWQNTDEAFLDIAKSIRRVIEEMSAAQPASDSSGLFSESSFQGASESIDTYSDNLRLPKTFTQLDKDSFLEESFEYIAQFFNNSLDKLPEQNPGIQGRFRRIDSRHFSAAVYRDGQDLSRCRIWYGDPQSFANGIAYSDNDYYGDNGYNELLSIVETDQGLFLSPLLTVAYSKNAKEYLTVNEVAELLWSLLMRPLQ